MIEQYRYLHSNQFNEHFQHEPIYDSTYAAFQSCSFPKKNTGKLGPSHVQFDLSTLIGQITLDNSTNTLMSNSQFVTIKTANCFLYKNKWMYEVLLLSKGIMQLGYSSSGAKNGSICNFTIEKGVGDCKFLYLK